MLHCGLLPSVQYTNTLEARVNDNRMSMLLPRPRYIGDGLLFSMDFFVYFFVCLFLSFFVSKIKRKRLDRFA